MVPDFKINKKGFITLITLQAVNYVYVYLARYTIVYVYKRFRDCTRL